MTGEVHLIRLMETVSVWGGGGVVGMVVEREKGGGFGRKVSVDSS